MLTIQSETKIWFSSEPVDMRKSINGLTALVIDRFDRSPRSSDLFVFYNKAKNKVKLIFWEKNGFVLYYKRFERGRLKFQAANTHTEICLNENQLQWLLAGLDFQLMEKFKELNYSQYY